MPPACPDDDHWEDPRFTDLKASQRGALPAVFARIRRFNGALTDEQLRVGLRISKRLFGDMVEAVIEWGWLRRSSARSESEPGTLGLALSAGALRMREYRSDKSERSEQEPTLCDLQRQIDDLTELVRQSFSFTAPEQALHGERTNSAQVAHESSTNVEQAKSPEQPINQLIDSSKHSLENSNQSIQLIEDPVAHQRAYLDSMLIQIGIDRADVLKAFEKRDLAFIAAGVECVKLGHWSKAKTKYDPKVSLSNYLLRDLQLPWSYQNFVNKRSQTALDILVPIRGRADAPRDQQAAPIDRASPPPKQDQTDVIEAAVNESLLALPDDVRQQVRRQAVAMLSSFERELLQKADRSGNTPGKTTRLALNAALYDVLLGKAPDAIAPSYRTGTGP